MPRVLNAIQRTQNNSDTTAVPTGYARAPTYKNPPGAVALKILHALIDHAGTAIEDDTVWHEMPLREAIRKTKIHHLSAEQADQHLDELEALRLSFWLYDVQKRKTIIERGVVVQHGRIEVPDPDSDEHAIIQVRFGSIFCQLVRTSDYYTLLQNNVIWGLRSRYAIALFQQISALSGQRKPSTRYSISELRAVLGVLPHRLQAYKDLHARALKPAVEQINASAGVPWTLTYEANRRGRGVHDVTITWTAKVTGIQPSLPLRLDGTAATGSTGEEAGETTPAKDRTRRAFPATGSIKETPWASIAAEHAGDYAPDRVADDYRTWCANSRIPLDKRGTTKRFTTFCESYAENQSKPRQRRRKSADHGYDGPSQDRIDRIEDIKREVDARFDEKRA